MLSIVLDELFAPNRFPTLAVRGRNAVHSPCSLLTWRFEVQSRRNAAHFSLECFLSFDVPF